MRIIVHTGADLNAVVARQPDFIAWSHAPHALLLLAPAEHVGLLRRLVPNAHVAEMPASKSDTAWELACSFEADLFVPADNNLTVIEEQLLAELSGVLTARLPVARKVRAEVGAEERENRLRADLAATTRELLETRNRLLDQERRWRRADKDRETMEAIYHDIRSANCALERHVGECEQRFQEDRSQLENHLHALTSSRWWRTGHRVKSWMQRVKRKLTV